MQYTACYTKIEFGYMGQLIEWPEVITEGATLEECRDMLSDAAHEMAAAYEDEGREIPKVKKTYKKAALHKQSRFSRAFDGKAKA